MALPTSILRWETDRWSDSILQPYAMISLRAGLRDTMEWEIRLENPGKLEAIVILWDFDCGFLFHL